MIYDKNNTETWPKNHQDVMVWSVEDGRTLATFYQQDYEGENNPGFGNWFNRTGDEDDAIEIYVTNPREWWPLPPLESM